MKSAQTASGASRDPSPSSATNWPNRAIVAGASVVTVAIVVLVLWLATPTRDSPDPQRRRAHALAPPRGTLSERAERVQRALDHAAAQDKANPGCEKTTWDFEWQSPPSPGPMPKHGVEFDWPAPLAATVRVEGAKNGDEYRAHYSIAFTRDAAADEFRLAFSNFAFDHVGDLGDADGELAQLVTRPQFLLPTLAIDDDGRATGVVELDAAFEATSRASLESAEALQRNGLATPSPILATLTRELDETRLNLHSADGREFLEDAAKKEWRWWVETVVHCDLVPGAEDTRDVELELVPGTKVDAELHRRNDGRADSPLGAIKLHARIELPGATLRPLSKRLLLVVAPHVHFSHDELDAASKSLEQRGLEILFDTTVDPAHGIPYRVTVEQRWLASASK